MVFDWHSQDSRASGPLEVAHTVTQQYGTGGGNTPMVAHDGLLCRATGQAGAETLTDCAPCLNCDHEAPIVAGCLNPEDNQSRRIYGEGGQAPTLSARESAGAEQTGVLSRSACGPPYIIRRLAPLECGRLQGFPDGWAETAPMDTDDPKEILFWMGVYVTDCKIKGKRVNAEIIKHPAKLARWHDGLHSAAAEYKMWGNGMALPNALFFLQRLQAVMGWCTIRLGSLFDGSGTMPLAAEMCGMRAVWASEVEPYPIAVTRTHLPYMEHLGSVTDIDGGTIPPVDVITFGSPCQDLSIAGRRAGLEGKRSGLFAEAVCIIREMRQATGGLYPRFAIWENVPGSLSSNGGKDFETVINTMLMIPPPSTWRACFSPSAKERTTSINCTRKFRRSQESRRNGCWNCFWRDTLCKPRTTAKSSKKGKERYCGICRAKRRNDEQDQIPLHKRRAFVCCHRVPRVSTSNGVFGVGPGEAGLY